VKANVFFQNASMISHVATGLMMQPHVPISAIPMSQYDVSVRDLVMTGKIHEIINLINRLPCNKSTIITSGNYGTLKVHINIPNGHINKVSLYPVAQAAIHNANFLVLNAVAGSISAPVSQLLKLTGIDTVNIYNLMRQKVDNKILNVYLKEFIETITVGELVSQSADFLLEKALSSKSKNKILLRPSIIEADKKSFMNFISILKNHIKPLIHPSLVERGADVSISQYSYISPECRDKEHYEFISWLKNKMNSVIKNDFIIKVGSNFNRSHAGVVIDLETRSIGMDELMFFLSVFDRKNKLVNCFLSSEV
jgi:hypothetical protein